MKNVIPLLLLLTFSFSLFSQKTNPNQYRYDRLMQSSVRKQRAGFIFLGIGAAATVGGIILIKDGTNKHNSYSGTGYYDNTADDELEQVAGALVTVIGVGLMAGSIPFFVGAHRSKMRAMSLSFKTESMPLQYKMGFSKQLYPALAFRIPLGK